LLLDELLNGLDDTNRGRALRWLQHTKRSRLPWVLTTHRVEDVPDCATHALVLEAGKIVYSGAIARAPLKRWLQADSEHPAPRVSMTRARSRASSKVLLRLTGATVYLDEHIALTNVSFEVRKGECWVIHGRNGSGKTTLLRTLYGDHGVAAGGRIERDGIEPGIPLQAFKTRVGLVAPHLQTQYPREFDVATVVQSGRHASIGLNDPPTAADRTAANRSLAFFGLSAFATRTLDQLSYGQMRRVLFARAWVRRPELLLLDEPFSGVDGPTRRELKAQVDSMIEAGAAVVMASHHRSEWPAGTTHELELEGGRVLYSGPVRLPGMHAQRQSGISSK
jgi:molybdate transport system ATP-binding protein